MQLKLVRSVFTESSSLGKLFINDKLYAFTCEDKDRNLAGNCSKKVQNKTAIDYGTYEVILSFSNHFQKYLPLLLNVKCFSGIRIHGGNTAADSEGCILIGAEGDMINRIWNCKSKLAALVSMLKSVEKKEKIFIEIVKS